jgi:putative nucleotidyltransferase with HDIG domain
MKKLFKKKPKGIAERKTEGKRKRNLPYKAVGLGMLLWLVVSWLFFGHGVMRHIDLAEGQSAPSTVVAAVDFECENLQETAFNRTKAAGEVQPVFTIDPAPAQRATQKIEALFNRVGEYATASTNQRPMYVTSISDLLLGSGVDTFELIQAFPPDTTAAARDALVKRIKDVMNRGVLSDEYSVQLFRDNPERALTIAGREGLEPRTVTKNDIRSTRKAVWAVSSQIEDDQQRKVAERLLHSLIIDNMTYDETTTDALRKEAADKVDPVIQPFTEGSILVRAGDSVTSQMLLTLKAHEQKRSEDQELLEQIMEIVGNAVLLLAGLFATAVILRVAKPELIRQPDRLLLMVLLSLITLVFARLLTYLSVQYSLIAPGLLTYLVPHALAVLLTGILLGGCAAISLGFWTSFATAVLFDQSFNVFALGMLITITATSTARNAHRRSSLFRAGLWVCAVKVLFVLVVAILNQPAINVIIGQIVAAVVSGMLATILTLLLIPLFEKLFKITTDITLLELSDMGHPLLQKMAIQAPGTYHHSLMVATLAQNAAEAIGANSLLIRVCAYYHDIGKMAKPEFFTENIQHKENPHDELSPHMSALVISSHVKEGLTLAKRHKLPQPILDAIEQHHGNGLISFFYHKAKQMAKEGAGGSMTEVINDSDFRYGGAPAVTPEMAILSLADAAEAAARSIEKPTPQKISNMMDDIFAMKIRDGQMDHANLTMAEINVVKQSFIFSLSNMLHGRIPYPKDNDRIAVKPTNKPSAESGEPPKAGGMAG